MKLIGLWDCPAYLHANYLLRLQSFCLRAAALPVCCRRIPSPMMPLPRRHDPPGCLVYTCLFMLLSGATIPPSPQCQQAGEVWDAGGIEGRRASQVRLGGVGEPSADEVVRWVRYRCLVGNPHLNIADGCGTVNWSASVLGWSSCLQLAANLLLESLRPPVCGRSVGTIRSHKLPPTIHGTQLPPSQPPTPFTYPI